MENRVTWFMGRLGHRVTALAVLALVMCFASVAGAVYYPPASRTVTWQGNVGVKGDIPQRTVIYKTLSPSGSDDTTAIQTAINNCPSGQVVQLSAGTFNVTHIDMKSGVTLRGAGIGVTLLKGNLTSTYYVISLGNDAFGIGTSYNLSSGFTKGSTSITTSAANGWQAGDVILIDQLQNPAGDPPVSNLGTDGTDTWDTRSSGTRGINQLVTVTSVSGNSATLDMPLYWSFDPTLSPQGTKITMRCQNAGVENLSIDSTTSFSTTSSNLQMWSTVEFYGSANNWLLGVDMKGVWGQGVGMESAYRNTIRSCRIHVPYQYTSSAGYAMLLTYGASANLVEDCIYDNLSNGPVLQNGSGNVFAYNYSTNMTSAQYPNTVRLGMQSNHGVHPYMNLFEGNYLEGCYMAADKIHGSSSHNTWFRNKVFANASVTSGYNQQLIDIAVWQNQTYYNVIGNVLGTSGFENYYQQTAIPYSSYLKYVYVLGATGGSSGTTGLETTSLIRHGNWDGYDNAVVWDPTISDHTLPQSLYLTAKPGWWISSMPWPAIGPDLTPMGGSIPARQRYLLTPPGSVSGTAK